MKTAAPKPGHGQYLRPAFHRLILRTNWPYVFKLTGFTLVVMLMALVILLIEASRQYVAYLTVWDCPVPARTPAELGLPDARLVQIRPRPGQSLAAWYAPSRNGAAILLLQGHWQGRDGMLDEAKMLARHGYGLMLLDPHPCAGPDVVHTLGHDEVADVAAAIDFMAQQPDIDPGRIGVLGYSIGGVIAVESAARIPRIQAIVAEGNFHDLTTNITPRGAQDTFIGSAARWLIIFFYRYYTGLDPDLVKPINSVAKISPRPLFLIAGEAEAGANHTLAQFEAAGQPKELWLVPEAGHGGYQQRWPEAYERRIIGFFDRSLLK